MQAHIKILGWMYILLGILGILGATLVFVLVAGGGLISGDETAIRITSIVGTLLGGLIALISIPGVITGMGLLKYKAWARILALVLGLLNLPGFPVGTLLGIYTIWILLDDESTRLFGEAS